MKGKWILVLLSLAAIGLFLAFRKKGEVKKAVEHTEKAVDTAVDNVQGTAEDVGKNVKSVIE